MPFNYTSQVFQSVDNVATNFVAANISHMIALVTPWVALGLVIALLAEGVSMMATPGGDPMSSLFKKFLRYAIIISFASAGGFYQTQLAQTALALPNQVSNVLTVNGQHGQSSAQTANVIDNTLSDGMTAAGKAFTHGSLFSGSGMAMYLLGASILIITVFICAIGAGLILMAKFMLAITVCFGPIFIFALLFRSTEALFTKWIGSIINYILVAVLLTLVFGFVIQFISKLVNAAASPGPSEQLLPLTVGAGLIAVASWFIMKAVPGIAASWGSGVQAAAHGFGGTARNAASGAAAGGRMGMGAAKGAASGAKGGGSAGAAAGSAVGGPAGAAVGGAAGAAVGAGGGAVGGAMRGLARGSRR